MAPQGIARRETALAGRDRVPPARVSASPQAQWRQRRAEHAAAVTHMHVWVLASPADDAGRRGDAGALEVCSLCPARCRRGRGGKIEEFAEDGRLT